MHVSFSYTHWTINGTHLVINLIKSHSVGKTANIIIEVNQEFLIEQYLVFNI